MRTALRVGLIALLSLTTGVPAYAYQWGQKLSGIKGLEDRLLSTKQDFAKRVDDDKLKAIEAEAKRKEEAARQKKAAEDRARADRERIQQLNDIAQLRAKLAESVANVEKASNSIADLTEENAKLRAELEAAQANVRDEVRIASLETQIAGLKEASATSAADSSFKWILSMIIPTMVGLITIFESAGKWFRSRGQNRQQASAGIHG